MDSRLIQSFGPHFLVNDIRELELLTDLLAVSKDHLNVVFAVASYLDQVPNGSRHFNQPLRQRLDRSVNALWRSAHALAPGAEDRDAGGEPGPA